MPDEITIDSIPFTFYNLRRLKSFNPFRASNHVLLIFSLLRSSPNLEKLEIWFVEMHEPEIDWEFLNA
ncbi:hypothetical protein U9M48_005506 [Paspalum notatum var. saurae]|uniref:Uncharacterized protein n=1 Tax=Paspalum notatum var. saurae TaxID=547442 RepID=A0AAQ3PXU9_PASNO